MIFKPELVDLIKQGKKTMTRRPVKAGEGECRYQVGRAYQVQRGRGKPGEETITIVEVRRERLGDVSVKDARREGFPNVAAFLRYWRSLYSAGLAVKAERIAREWFQLPHGTGRSDWRREQRLRAAGRLYERMAPNLDQEVWVITFGRGDLTDTDRFLAARPPSQFCGRKIPETGRRCGRAFRDGQAVCVCGAPRPPRPLDDIGYTAIAKRGMEHEKPAVTLAYQAQLSKEANERTAASSWEPIYGRAARLEGELRDLRQELAALDKAMPSLSADRQRTARLRRRQVDATIHRHERALTKLRRRLPVAA